LRLAKEKGKAFCILRKVSAIKVILKKLWSMDMVNGCLLIVFKNTKDFSKMGKSKA
jgi:hypothetical protein